MHISLISMTLPSPICSTVLYLDLDGRLAKSSMTTVGLGLSTSVSFALRACSEGYILYRLSLSCVGNVSNGLSIGVTQFTSTRKLFLPSSDVP